MDVASLLHKVLHLSGTNMSLLVWSNKDTVAVLTLKFFILSTLIILYGTIPLGQIYGVVLYTEAQAVALPRHIVTS